MLYRVVRPMKRDGSRFQLYVRRIPVDVRERLIGRTLHFPVGDETHAVTISPRAQAIRFSLRADDPAVVKQRIAAADQYFERILRAFRDNSPTSLTNAQATALAGRLYRAWAGGEGRERTHAVEQGPDGKMHPVPHDPEDDAAIFEAALVRLVRLETIGKHEMDKPRPLRNPVDLDHLPPADECPEVANLEIHLGRLVDRLLLSEGIRCVDTASRGLLLKAFWLALRDAFEVRLRNARGDYSPDPRSERFPAWVGPNAVTAIPPQRTAMKAGSLVSLVEGWWVEAKARNLKPSTHESYSNSMAAFVAFLGHDDCSRVTKDDVIGFKDHRLATINPRTKRPITAKTVKDNDLSGLKAVFGWAVANGKMHSNPAEGVTLKASKPRKLRSKAFTEQEAKAILTASLHVKRGREQSETFAAKRWVPWLMAYSGARVGEMAQLRKEDLKRSKDIWYLTVTPEAGTVKTNEARDVVLHPHLIDTGFVEFVKSAPPGHLFLRPANDGDVLGPLQGIKNRLAEFAREIVTDKGVAPNHGWRHRFKPIGTRAGIDRRTLDVISGHALEGRTVADGYHGVELEDQAAALAKYPRYEI
ncbi:MULTISPECIES: site-specific integrase [unclassified Bradyrhizobium]|uniref:tyrosine-type recombinase/integrase n=1 Tax=unclassified Bradyrhizobium TaxID=2631580 RepID=UPI001CD396CA|nr:MULTISPECIES: site-specific integrase [unclassified Bradyrhizobium]MCA1377014.1 recombinase XerD [Bradyrhizobium sp. IC4060]MCA1484112.1 recombinase XerD [Bradyrhizobium sp. IC4061]